MTEEDSLAEHRLKTTMWNAALEHAAGKLEEQKVIMTSGKVKSVQNYKQAASLVRSLMVRELPQGETTDE
jgi:hypothetical protein